ncbi:MAG TPA: LLM class F420-dependent oxidoreductase [Microthrixaceae bacterium]|nr:LLM class F420-dependent oxidoreductase [Microthrixaceae bacterium]
MHIAVLPPYRAGVAADPAWMTRFALRVEELGFESLYLPEHVVVVAGYDADYPYSSTGRMPLPDDCPMPDPLDLAAFLLARTERLVLATGVLVAPHHHPLVLAKRVATLDVLSGGRFRLGVGVGWMREELEATGIEFESRGRRLDEQLEVMRAVWAGDDVDHDGEFYSFRHVWSRPQPLSGAVPVHVGGHSKAAARRAGRQGDGFQPLGIDDDVLVDRLEVMAESARDAGRDVGAIELTLGAPLQQADRSTIEARGAQGATRLLLSSATADFDQLDDELTAAAERLGLRA